MSDKFEFVMADGSVRGFEPLAVTTKTVKFYLGPSVRLRDGKITNFGGKIALAPGELERLREFACGYRSLLVYGDFTEPTTQRNHVIIDIRRAPSPHVRPLQKAIQSLVKPWGSTHWNWEGFEEKLPRGVRHFRYENDTVIEVPQ